MNDTIWREPIAAAEAAEKLLAFVREIRELDAQFEQMMRRKAAIYRQAKKDGYNKLAVKTIANEPSIDDDTKVLRKYLDLLCGSEAASAMRDVGHFGVILFGEADSWPSEYVDQKHGAADQ
jgi:uncharacterized protein (UPF0335 family)